MSRRMFTSTIGLIQSVSFTLALILNGCNKVFSVKLVFLLSFEAKVSTSFRSR